MVKKALILLACLSLVACSQTVRGDYCKIGKPHRFSPDTIDHMTDEEIEQETAHNLTGQMLCGWKP